MRKVWKIIKWVLMGFLVLALVIWIILGLWFSLGGGRWLKTTIEKKYQTRLEIAKVRTNFFNSISLFEITAKEPIPLSIQKLTFTYRPWRIFWSPGTRSGLFHINIIGLTVDLTNHPFEGRAESSSSLLNMKFSIPPIFLETEISSFTLRSVIQKKAVEVHGGSALLDMSPLKWEGWFKGASAIGGKIRAHLMITKGLRTHWQGLVYLQDLPIENAIRWFDLKEKTTGYLKGNLNVELTAGGLTSMRGKTSKVDWKAKIGGEHLLWSLSPSDSPLLISGQIQLSPKNIEIKKITLGSGCEITGEVFNPFHSHSLRLFFKGKEFPLSQLQQSSSLLFFRNLKGKTDFNLMVTGSFSNPVVDGTFDIEPQYNFLKVPFIHGNVRFTKGLFSIDSNFSGGQAFFSANMENKAKMEAVFKDVSLRPWAEENGWKNIFGQLDAKLVMDLSQPDLSLSGAFELDQFHWGRHITGRPIKGRIELAKRQWNIITNNNFLIAKGKVVDHIVQFDQFLLDFGEGSTLQIIGIANLIEKSMAFDIRGNRIRPDVWPALADRYPEIIGFIDFKGFAHGKLEDPKIELNLEVNKLRLVRAGQSWIGSADVRASKDEAFINNIVVKEGIQGNVLFKNKGRENSWKIDIKFKNAKPDLIFELAKSSASIAGRINGFLEGRWEGDRFIGISSGTWVNGRYDSVVFDELNLRGSSDGRAVAIDQLGLIEGNQALRASGVLTPLNKDWNYDLSLQLQHWGTDQISLDGEIQATGLFRTEHKKIVGLLAAPILYINNYSFENVKAELKKDKELFRFAGQGEPNLKFDLRVQNQEWGGYLKAKSLKIEEMIGKLFPTYDPKDLPAGQAQFSIFPKGTLTNPQFQINLESKEVKWREESFKLFSRFEVQKSIFQIVESSVVFRQGGVLTLQGIYSRESKNSHFLHGVGKGIEIQSVFNLLDWPVRWKGLTNLKMDFNNKEGHDRLSVSLDGHHDGFGPFKNGGLLSGKAVYENRIVNLSGILVESGNGFVKLLEGSQIFIDRAKLGTMRLVADSRNLQAGLVTLFGGAEMTGTWHTPQSDKTKESFLEMDIFARSLWINQFVLDGNVTHLSLKKGQLEFSPIAGSGQNLSGELEFSHFPTLEVKDFSFVEEGQKRVTLDGLVGNNKWDFRLNLKEVDANLVLAIFNTTIPLSGMVSAQIIGKGSPEEPLLSAETAWRDGELSFLPLDEARCRLNFDNHFLDIKNLVVFKKNGYQLTGDMRFPLSDEKESKPIPEIDLLLTHGDLALVRQIWPDCTKSKGSFEGKLVVREIDGRPFVEGNLTMQRVFLRTNSYLPELSQGEFTLKLKGNRLFVDEGKAHLGKGSIQLNGNILFDGLETKEYDLTLRTLGEQGISIRVPELSIPAGPVLGRFGKLGKKLGTPSKGEPKLMLSLQGPALDPKLSGEIVLENTSFTYPPSNLPKSDRLKNPLINTFNNLRDKIIWDLNIRTGTKTWFQNDSVDAKIQGRLFLNGPTSDLEVNGRINTQQGAIVYFGNQFKIKNAEIEISTQSTTLDRQEKTQTLVYLEALAEKEVYYTDGLGNTNQDTICMKVDRSLFGNIQPRFYSKNNPHISSQRSAQLALGFSVSESIDANTLIPDQRIGENKENIDKQLRVAMIGLVDSSLASPLARALARQTGLVDFIRVSFEEKDPYTNEAVKPGGSANSPSSTNVTQNQFLQYMKGTKVQMGRGITNRLFADYSFRVDEYQNQLDLRHQVEVIYQFHRNFFIRAVSELDSESTLGRPPDRRALLENQWRFGSTKKKKKQEKIEPETQKREKENP